MLAAIIFWTVLLAGTAVETTPTQIRILTFNIWDLFVSHARELRMRAIIEELKRPRERAAVRDHDVMAFQEMWSADTYRLFCEGLVESHPYSHHYSRSALGSGLAIFSRYPILRVSFYKFVLNGNPARILDGDWFVGKGVAHARIRHPRGIIDFFTTHLIADYSNNAAAAALSLMNERDGADEYLSHRLTQAYEMMQFVQSRTHPKAIATFLVGDLNFEMNSLPWRAFLEGQDLMLSIYANLPRQDVPCTCNCPLNGYSKRRSRPSTIDHILYSRDKLTLSNFDLAFTGEIPLAVQAECGLFTGCPRSYSDHFGVSAVFHFSDALPPSKRQRHEADQRHHHDAILKTVRVLKRAQKVASRQQRVAHHVWLLLLVVLLVAMGLAVYIMASPTVQANLPFYLFFSLVPLICASIVLNMLMGWLQYPSDCATLGQYAAEISLLFQGQAEGA